MKITKVVFFALITAVSTVTLAERLECLKENMSQVLKAMPGNLCQAVKRGRCVCNEGKRVITEFYNVKKAEISKVVSDLKNAYNKLGERDASKKPSEKVEEKQVPEKEIDLDRHEHEDIIKMIRELLEKEGEQEDVPEEEKKESEKTEDAEKVEL